MATLISDIVAKSVTANTDKKDLGAELKLNIMKSYYENMEKEAVKIREKNEKNVSGDSYSKTIQRVVTSAQNDVKEADPVIKKRINQIVSDLLGKDSKNAKVVDKAIESYLDNCVDDICGKISKEGKTAEEYRIYIEAAIRSFHSTIVNNPELQKQIAISVLSAAQLAATDEVSTILKPMMMNANTAITNTGHTATNIVDSISKQLTSYNIDSIIKNTATTTLNNLAESIANNTFGKLTTVPIIGPYFATLQTAMTNSLETAGQNWFATEYTKLSKYTKQLVENQEKIVEYQKLADEAIERAQNIALEYTQKLEQKAINEIKKYINLENVSIGGFKF